jgi:hypothetical protein
MQKVLDCNREFLGEMIQNHKNWNKVFDLNEISVIEKFLNKIPSLFVKWHKAGTYVHVDLAFKKLNKATKQNLD